MLLHYTISLLLAGLLGTQGGVAAHPTELTPRATSTPFSGQGHLLFRLVSTGATDGCVTATGELTTGGTCGVFTGVLSAQGVDIQLSTSAGLCGFDSSLNLVCEQNNGYQNFHVSIYRSSELSLRFGAIRILR